MTVAAKTGAYGTLEGRFRRMAALQEAAGMLHWDMATLMPSGGAAARSEQLTVLVLLRHELLCDPRTAELLGSAEGDVTALGPWQAANLAEMRRIWSHGNALEPRLVEALSKVARSCEMLWREARPKADFALILPLLEQLLGLVREEAAAKAEALGCGPYDALLDLYEPGAAAAEIDVLFDDLSSFLPDFLAAVLERQAAAPAPSLPEGPFDVAVQENLGRRLMTAVGFDFDHGRLDQSLHPFCGGVPDDVRITTRYDEADFQSSLMGILHETGHALYERCRNA